MSFDQITLQMCHQFVLEHNKTLWMVWKQSYQMNLHCNTIFKMKNLSPYAHKKRRGIKKNLLILNQISFPAVWTSWFWCNLHSWAGWQVVGNILGRWPFTTNWSEMIDHLEGIFLHKVFKDYSHLFLCFFWKFEVCYQFVACFCWIPR